MLQSQSKEKLRKIAIDIVDLHIFTSLHINDKEITSNIFKCFPSLLFLQDIEIIKEIGLIYGYYTEALFKTNTYPVFKECYLLNKEDSEEVLKYAKEYEEFKLKFLNGEIKCQ